MSKTKPACGRYTEKVRVGRAELQVVIAGKGLLPTADGTACCSSSSSSIRRGRG